MARLATICPAIAKPAIVSIFRAFGFVLRNGHIEWVIIPIRKHTKNLLAHAEMNDGEQWCVLLPKMSMTMPFSAYDDKALRLLSTAHIGVMEEVKAKCRLDEAEMTNANRRTSLILMRVFDEGERDVAALTMAGLNGLSATSEQSLRRTKPPQPVTSISRRKTRLDAVAAPRRRRTQPRLSSTAAC
jgi:hypothetical protein